jgi:quercetin dioxygenase-like cupin family protein
VLNIWYTFCMSIENPASKESIEGDKFPQMVELLKRSHQIIDTGVLNEKHEEILNNLEFGNFNGESFSMVLLEKDVQRPPHIHHTSMAKFYFIEGEGYVILNGESVPYEKGTYIEVPAGAAHGFDIIEDTLMLSIQDNDGIIKEDKSIDFTYE